MNNKHIVNLRIKQINTEVFNNYTNIYICVYQVLESVT